MSKASQREQSKRWRSKVVSHIRQSATSLRDYSEIDESDIKQVESGRKQQARAQQGRLTIINKHGTFGSYFAELTKERNLEAMAAKIAGRIGTSGSA